MLQRFRKVFRRPDLSRKQLLFYCLPPLLMLAAFFTVNIKTDLSAFILSGESAEEVLLASEMQSGALSRRYLLSLGAKQGNVPNEVVKALQTKLQNIDGVTEVWSPSQQSDTVQNLQKLYSRHAAAFYSLTPERDLQQLFTPEGLQQRAEFLRKALLSQQGAIVKAIAKEDSLLLTLNGFRGQAEQMRQSADKDSSYRSLIVETEMAGLNVPEQQRIQQTIGKAFDNLNSERGDQYKLDMTGVPVFAVATQNLIKGDIEKVSTLSSIALLVLFLLIFRSVSSLFQVFSLLLITILSAMLTTQVVFGYVHGMTIAFGSTLVGICIDYPIHALAHAHSVDVKQRSAMVGKVWPSMVLGGVTTLIGYIALGGSGYPGFQQIAVYAGTGIVLALLLTRFVLPALITKPEHRQLNMLWVARWALFSQRYRMPLVLILLLGLVAAVYGLQSLRWMEDMQQLTPELNYLKENDKRIRARMVSVEPGRFIMISGENNEVALQKTEEVYKVLAALKQQGALNEYFGLYPWALSVKQQQHNRAALNGYLTPENLALWQEALQQQGLSVKRLGHFDYPQTSPLTLAQIFDTPVKRFIDSRIIRSAGKTVVMIWIAEHDYDAVKAAFADMDGVQYFSYRELLNTMLHDYTEQAKHLLLIGLSLIIALLIVRYKSLFKAIQTLLPAMLAALFIFGLWAWTGALISFLHLVGFLLAVAICVDYGIFYQENRGGDIALTYQAMAASMLTSVLAFGCLIIADSSSLRVLAGVVALGVFLGFLFCPIIIRHAHRR